MSGMQCLNFRAKRLAEPSAFISQAFDGIERNVGELIRLMLHLGTNVFEKCFLGMI